MNDQKSNEPMPQAFTFDGKARLKYARLLLIEGGFSPTEADQIVGTGEEDAAARDTKYVTQQEVAHTLRCSRRHVRDLTAQNEIPVAFRDGLKPFYRISDVDAFMARRAGAHGRKIIANAREIHRAA